MADSGATTEDQAEWLGRAHRRNPELLALRERLVPWTGGLSYAHVEPCDYYSALSQDRHAMLEMVHQHLMSVGMKRTADTMSRETSQPFQIKEQPWNKTDLMLLASLGVRPREDPWSVTGLPHCHFGDESFDEDYFRATRREDPELLRGEVCDEYIGVAWNDPSAAKTFSNMRAASLRRIVVFVVMSCHDPAIIPSHDLERFFLVLHSITMLHHFLEHLIAMWRLAMTPPEEDDVKNAGLNELRLHGTERIIDLIGKWTKCQGLFIGRRTLATIGHFMQEIMEAVSGSKEADMAKLVLDSIPSLRYGRVREVSLRSELEIPIISEKEAGIIFKPTLTIMEPEPEEVARQITLLFHRRFNAIRIGEFMTAFKSKRISHQTPALSEFLSFGNNLMLLCLEIMIGAKDKTTIESVSSRIIQIAVHLDKLANYHAVSYIVNALDKVKSATKDYAATFRPRLNTLKEICARCGESLDASDEGDYVRTVEEKFLDQVPVIPNIRCELRDAQKKKVWNIGRPSSEDGDLIDWENPWILSKKMEMIYRFQNESYNLCPVPQIQAVIKSGPAVSESYIMEEIKQLHRQPAP